jgi:pilus assembly protein CpaF
MNTNKRIYIQIREQMFEAIDAEQVKMLSRKELESQISDAIDLIVDKNEWPISSVVLAEFKTNIIDELIGLGPLQVLMDNPSINDIMINGPEKVFVERNGLVELSSISFLDEAQLLNIAKRIAAKVGRRVDDSQPTCDARLPDGSRVNIVIPPIAIDGTSMSIRKFKADQLGLDNLVEFGALSSEMALILKIGSHCRLNIIISGGTGSGKTTMLNALSQFVSEKERIVTIEDTAELGLQQPHVVRLETRDSGVEGTGAVTQRDLVINALRMRPDRIILGECRGSEAFEMLQSMNTGHDGSMSTLHANTPRDAISRIESMVMMGISSLPLSAVRRTIVSAVDLIIQVSRLHDGSRRVMSITEVVGLEGDNVILEEIYAFKKTGQNRNGKIAGEFVSNGMLERSALVEKARFFGLEQELSSVMSHNKVPG